MSDIIRSSLEGVRSFTDMQTVIGNAIHTPSGVTVIPVSKVSVGFAGGGVDFGIKKLVGAQNFGSGSGSGVSITPIAFLTIGKNAEINLLQISQEKDNSFEKITSLIVNYHEIIRKLKNTFSED